MNPLAIACGKIAARIDRRGAQLSALRREGAAYLYEADAPRFWNRSAPILFPVVGRCSGDRILVDGRAYPMPRHGFARDLDWEPVRCDPSVAELVLRSSEATRRHFPFEFALQARYEAREDGLDCDYALRNVGVEAMPFSFGLHPAFRWPLDDSPRESWEVTFPRPMKAGRIRLVDGLRAEGEEPLLEGQGRLPLRDELFRDDAIVIRDPGVTTLSLVSALSPRAVRIEFSPASWLGIWSVPGAPFVCLEPWQGVAGRPGESGDLWEKEAMLRLAPGATWRYRLAISLR